MTLSAHQQLGPSALRMPEAEVSLRLAMHLVTSALAVGDIDVAIDGAQVRTGDVEHFNLVAFMAREGWSRCDAGSGWSGNFARASSCQLIRVHSRPGLGDVCAKLAGGHTLVVEAKKGPLVRSKSSAEYPLLREALGQLLTMAVLPDRPMLAVAVPASDKFDELASRWRQAPLIRSAGIHILTVSRSGAVGGWPTLAAD